MSKPRYRLFHWWDGDKFTDPQWVHTGDFIRQSLAEAEISKMRRMGWKKFRLVKVETNEEIIK